FVDGSLVSAVEVPQFAFKGGEAKISCRFNLHASTLYSLKWYHNNTEFYRYVPTERHQPINIKPQDHNFYVLEANRSSQEVRLVLRDLKEAASGEYRCEVIAEHPSFTTDSAKQ
ncbi:unnamed protein product, partial [Meganyctiphanes norvegica]